MPATKSKQPSSSPPYASWRSAVDLAGDMIAVARELGRGKLIEMSVHVLRAQSDLMRVGREDSDLTCSQLIRYLEMVPHLLRQIVVTLEGCLSLMRLDEFLARGQHVRDVAIRIHDWKGISPDSVCAALTLAEDVFGFLQQRGDLFTRSAFALKDAIILLEQTCDQVKALSQPVSTCQSLTNALSALQQLFRVTACELHSLDHYVVWPRFEDRQAAIPAPHKFISSIPEEVLARIFYCVIAHQENSNNRPRLLLQTAISHVCRRWRRITLSLPQLWSMLYFRTGRDVYRNMEWIDRSINVDLHLCLSYPDEDSSRIQSFFNSTTPRVHLRSQITRLTLEGEVLRIVTVLPNAAGLPKAINGPFHELARTWPVVCFTKIFEHLSYMTALTRLDIGELIWPGIVQGPTIVAHLPCLRRLELRRVDVYFATAVFLPCISAPRLEHLSIICPSNKARDMAIQIPKVIGKHSDYALLVELDLEGVVWMEHAATLLVQLPNLEVLRVQESPFFSTAFCAMIVTRSALRKLHTLLLFGCANATGDGIVHLVRHRQVPTRGSEGYRFTLAYDRCPLVVGEDKAWLDRHTNVIHWRAEWLSYVWWFDRAPPAFW